MKLGREQQYIHLVSSRVFSAGNYRFRSEVSETSGYIQRRRFMAKHHEGHQANAKCAHGACACLVFPSQSYCSDYCATASTGNTAANLPGERHPGEACGCGHPECRHGTGHQVNAKCAHAPCVCLVQPGESYCSRYCETASAASPSANVAGQGHSDTRCGCGHPECERQNPGRAGNM